MRLFTQDLGFRRALTWGIWPSLGFYAPCEGEMSRNWLVVCLLMPFLIVSIVPLVVSVAMQLSSGWLAFMSVLNVLCACVEILLAGSVLFQIPANATVRFRSW